MRREILLFVAVLCYVPDSSTLRTHRYRVVTSGKRPEVKQFKRNVKLDDTDDELDDLRSVLEEVIGDSSDDEPARITEQLTSRGTLDFALEEWRLIMTFLVESSALKKILARLLSENNEPKTVSQRSRSGRRQEFTGRFPRRQELTGGFPRRQELPGDSSRRQESSGVLSRQEDCDVSYRTEISPQCDTVVETVCSNQTVTRTRPDIKEKCTTRVTPGKCIIFIVIVSLIT